MILEIKNKTKSIRHLGAVNISELKETVLKLPDTVWNIETKRRENNFWCFTGTQHIVFKFHTDIEDPKNYKEKPLWLIWQSRLLPLMKKAVAAYGYKEGVFPKVMLAKLLPHSKIDAHIDANPRNRRLHKIHIPLQTNEKVQFLVKDNSYFLEEGQAYEVNNIVTHQAINDSDETRIHLIFEYFDANQ